jgi:hypothetical protein
MSFDSKFIRRGTVYLPEPNGTRIMMMPIVLGDLASVPEEYRQWHHVLTAIFNEAAQHGGRVGYLTIDEKTVEPNKTHRRAGKHVDGIYEGRAGSWGGGGGGGWGAAGNGMYTVSSHVGCRAWNQSFDGWPGNDGECDHLSEQCCDDRAEDFEANRLYWVDGLCVHESLPMKERTQRTFLRVSMPSCAPWFDGYTANSLGVKPTGEILPRRKFMEPA